MEGDYAEKHAETIEKSLDLTTRTGSECTCSSSTVEESGDNMTVFDKTSPATEAESEPPNDDCQCCGETEEAEETETTSETETDHNNFSNHGQRRSRAPAIILSKDGKKPKLRTSKDVYDRLKWDSASVLLKNEQGEDQVIDMSSVFVGYKDRFLGMCEIQFDDFEPAGGGGEIPFHRIYYFRTGGPPIEPFIGEDGEMKVREDNLPIDAVFIWDRDSRTDLIFKSGNSIYLKKK